MFKTGGADPVLCATVYRPPKHNAIFQSEFPEFLSSDVLKFDRILITGDFNFHVDIHSNASAAEFLGTMDSFNFIQHVSGPTHIHGYTLDLVFTLGLTITSLNVDDLVVSNHKCIMFSTPFHAVPNHKMPVRYSRSINSSTASNFADAYSASSLFKSVLAHPHHLSTEQLITAFN